MIWTIHELYLQEVVDIWIAQAESLQELRKYDYAKKKFNTAENMLSELASRQPNSMDVWFHLGRIYLASSQPDKATQAFHVLDALAKKAGNILVAKQALDGLSRSSRLRAVTEQSLEGKVAEGIFYTCQACGRPILFLGTHCPHCRFAPSTRDEVAIGIILSTLYLHAPQLLDASREIQKGRKPAEFMSQLKELIPRVDDRAGVLSKLEQHKADDHLDFKLLEVCHHCGTVSKLSWVRECPKCNATLDRPDLVKLAICIDRLIQHFVWNIRRDMSKSFSDFLTLLVNVKGKIIRHQTGPAESERKWAHKLLLGISPIYTENGGGVVEIKSTDEINGKVLDPSIYPDIGLAVNHLEGELRAFARLTSGQVGLF